GFGHRDARARYAHTMSAVLLAWLVASTSFLLERLAQAVVRRGHAQRELVGGLLLARIAGEEIGGVLPHHRPVRGLDRRQVGAGLEIEHAVPLGELRVGGAGARRPRGLPGARRRRRGPAARLHAAERLVRGLALARLARVALLLDLGAAIVGG